MKAANGEMLVWSVETMSDGVVVEHGVLGGRLQHKYEEIHEGKANRTPEEQINLRYYSRLNKAVDKGYKETFKEASEGRTNGLGLPKAMLAKPIKDVKNMDLDGAVYQHKYDGNRCLITKIDGRKLAYTRNGKFITSIDHILDGIEIKEGRTIDGELYCHGIPLQTINSWIKKKQDASRNLSFRCYDMISNRSYIERLDYILCMKLGTRAEVVPYWALNKDTDIKELFNRSKSMGYEGGIIRWGTEGYQDGKRSKYLVKIKKAESKECEVIDIIPSKDGWARLVLDCGITVSCHGDMPYKYRVMKNRLDYVGKSLTIEYYSITKDNKPFHPIAIAFREDL